MNFSKNRMAEVFGVDRSTLFAWIRRGCPCIEATEPGQSAQLSFKEVLAWRKIDIMSKRWGTDESVAEMEAAARERLKQVKKSHQRVVTP
jgi:hypothetical protein